MCGLPQVAFSLLWSSTIFTPIARLSALACFVDIALLYGFRNRSRPTTQDPFELIQSHRQFRCSLCRRQSRLLPSRVFDVGRQGNGIFLYFLVYYVSDMGRGSLCDFYVDSARGKGSG